MFTKSVTKKLRGIPYKGREGMNIIGLDIGGTKCAAVSAVIDGGEPFIEERISFKTADFDGFEGVCSEFFKAIDRILGKHPERRIDAIGISCGGPLDSTKGVIKSPPNLPTWDNVPICEIFRKRYSVPVFLQNDANACAVAEWKFGAGVGYRNLVFLTFGTGMGAGLILDGRLYSGTNDMAGEVGHIRVADGGPVGYGKKGSFEGFCSGGGIERLAAMMYKDKTVGTSLTPCDLSAKAVAEEAKKGDAFALSVYSKCAEKLGMGLSVIIDILNPEIIVIGSIFERSGDLLRDKMMQVIEAEALPLSKDVCKIVPAKLSDKIGDYAAIGVAVAGLENMNG